MDAAKRLAIGACGRCGQPEAAHWHPAGDDPEALAVLAALGGACQHFTASDASLRYQQHLAIASHRAPTRRLGALGKRPQLCGRCGYRGHSKENCPL
jgi:ribosomal protein S27AE